MVIMGYHKLHYGAMNVFYKIMCINSTLTYDKYYFDQDKETVHKNASRF